MDDIAYLGFPGYSIDAEGHVYNIYSEREVNRSVAKDGQLKVNLKTARGGYATILVGRLVADIYVPKPTWTARSLDTILYKNCDKSDPRAVNLEWRTRPYCYDYYYQMERPRIFSLKRPIVCVDDQRVFYTVQDAAMFYGLTPGTIIESVCNDYEVRRTWPTGHLFRFHEE